MLPATLRRKLSNDIPAIVSGVQGLDLDDDGTIDTFIVQTVAFTGTEFTSILPSEDFISLRLAEGMSVLLSIDATDVKFTSTDNKLIIGGKDAITLFHEFQDREMNTWSFIAKGPIPKAEELKLKLISNIVARTISEDRIQSILQNITNTRQFLQYPVIVSPESKNQYVIDKIAGVPFVDMYLHLKDLAIQAPFELSILLSDNSFAQPEEPQTSSDDPTLVVGETIGVHSFSISNIGGFTGVLSYEAAPGSVIVEFETLEVHDSRSKVVTVSSRDANRGSYTISMNEGQNMGVRVRLGAQGDHRTRYDIWCEGIGNLKYTNRPIS